VSSPLDRIEENAGELDRNADRFAADEPFLSVVLSDGAENLRALVNVAKAAEETVASYGNPLYPAYTDVTLASGGEFVSAAALRALREALAALKEPDEARRAPTLYPTTGDT